MKKKNAPACNADQSARTAPSYTQAHAIKCALERGEMLTQRDAINRFKCYRLAPVIHRLRQTGLNIQTEIVKSADGVRFARYWLARATA